LDTFLPHIRLKQEGVTGASERYGAGMYEEGDMVRVRAPVEESMKGFLGTLGGKYRFNRWTGAVESKDSEVVVQMTGEQTVLTLTALYDENYT